MGSTLDLVIVVVQANDIGAGEFDHFSCWTTNTASDVQNSLALLHVHDVGEVVLVTGNCLFEWLAVCESAEVEGLAPAVLVEIGSEVVIVSGEGSVFCFPCLEHRVSPIGYFEPGNKL